jgi:putative PIN family toxin of toxin-antitoxin system
MTVRAVLDSNVVVSALLFEEGQVAWLRATWSGGRCAPLVSAATTEELLRVLAYPKFRLSAEEREELLGDYLPFAETVIVPEMPDVPRCADSDDQKFLELAFAGRASLLITGDRALLALSGKVPFEIVRSAQARALIGE